MLNDNDNAYHDYSLIRSSDQQWDYPNGFAPINHMVIEGLRKSNHPVSVIRQLSYKF